MNSAVYEGHVRHRRFSPVEHRFRYRLYMLYLDLAELDTVFRRRPAWSARRPALAWFRRADHYGPRDEPLAVSIRKLVRNRLGRAVRGPIRLLTHVRYFGYVINPISVYFCFDKGGERLDALVLEVTNTPWGERHMYVLDGRSRPCNFAKALHVSPFMEMDYAYRCHFREPDERVILHLENWRENAKRFDATLVLRRREFTAGVLRRCLMRFPFMTARVALAIYFQALRLRLKGASFFPHPNRTPMRKIKEAQS